MGIACPRRPRLAYPRGLSRAKRNGVNLRKNPLALLRAALADRWTPKIERLVRKELRRQIDEALARVEAGVDEPVTGRMLEEWETELGQLKKKPLLMMTAHGYELTRDDMAGRSIRAEFLTGKAAVEFGPDEVKGLPFVNRNPIVALETFINQTSRVESRTSARGINRVFDRARTEVVTDDEGRPIRGLTPREIAKEMRPSLERQTMIRARMLARTYSQWSYNEGALQGYADDGIAVVQWQAGEDDLTCQFCVQLDGRMVRTGDAFVPAGTEFPGLAGGTLKIPSGSAFDMRHPPIHPSCRCALLPVIDAADAQEALEEGERLREEFSRRVASGEQKEVERKLRQRRRKRKKKIDPPKADPVDVSGEET